MEIAFKRTRFDSMNNLTIDFFWQRHWWIKDTVSQNNLRRKDFLPPEISVSPEVWWAIPPFVPINAWWVEIYSFSSKHCLFWCEDVNPNPCPGHQGERCFPYAHAWAGMRTAKIKSIWPSPMADFTVWGDQGCKQRIQFKMSNVLGAQMGVREASREVREA